MWEVTSWGMLFLMVGFGLGRLRFHALMRRAFRKNHHRAPRN